jgi:hypothetical protein
MLGRRPTRALTPPPSPPPTNTPKAKNRERNARRSAKKAADARQLAMLLQLPQHLPEYHTPGVHGLPLQPDPNWQVVPPAYAYSTQAPPPPARGPLIYCQVHGYTRSARGHTSAGCVTMDNDKSTYTAAMRKATDHTQCGGSALNMVSTYATSSPPPRPNPLISPYFPPQHLR